MLLDDLPGDIEVGSLDVVRSISATFATNHTLKTGNKYFLLLLLYLFDASFCILQSY